MKLLSHFSGPIGRATIQSLAIQVGGIAFGVIQAILTARLLGPEGYGAVAFVFSLSLLLATLALLGTEPLAVREVARLKALKDTDAIARFMRDIRRPVLAACLVGVLVLIAWIQGFAKPDGAFEGLVWFTVLLFPIFAILLQNQGILRGYGRIMMAQAPFHIARPMVTVFVLVAVWVSGRQLVPEQYLFTIVLATIVALAFSYLALSRLSFPKAARSATGNGLVKIAAPFFLITVLGLLLREINTLMLAGWSNAEQTGLFQPIARIAPLIMLGTQAVSMMYAPRVSELWTQGELGQLRKITRLFTWTTTAFAVVTAVLVIAFGDLILGLFGKAFTVNTPALLWVAGAQIVNAACGPAGVLLTMTNKASAAIWPQVAGLLVNIALGALLIPTQGAYGAAVAMSLGIVTWNLGMLISARHHLGMDPSLLAGLFGKNKKLE